MRPQRRLDEFRRQMAGRTLWLCTGLLLVACSGEAQKSLELNPTRPTVANGTGIQDKGVLQVEMGYDVYPQAIPGEQQTVDTSVFYTPWERARLDFTWSGFDRIHSADQQADGIGTVKLGTKIVLVKDKAYHWLPAIGLQYEAELPTASEEALQGYGQQAILLLNHHVGPLNLILNGSVVQTDCQTKEGCSIGGQQSAAVSYHVTKHTTLYAEAFGQNVSQSNSPPGTYIFGGFLHRFSDSMGINGGLRFGVSDHSASFGTTVGLVFGKRLQGGT